MSITIDQCMDLAKLVPVLEPLLVFSVLGATLVGIFTVIALVPTLRFSKLSPILGVLSVCTYATLAVSWASQYPEWQNLLVKLQILIGA